ncbi:hypothetical protein A9Q84_03255 [Halobacteriovorax marinus]|mgnify:CR=1 FL=1|uniref:Uncharacterized protein n=1 Tax=Halobacteriovorax marinus TaxID=97084 RepID=A0A1Y5FFM1_9BACT|nr:hypothetical protein A9Q84_03255 [Halobacteriovorax marinus]
MKTILLLTLLTIPRTLSGSEAARYAKHGCYVQNSSKACQAYKRLTAVQKKSKVNSEDIQEEQVIVQQEREIASTHTEDDPVTAFNRYLSLIESLKIDEYKDLKELVTKEAMTNLEKHKRMIGFYFAMVKSKKKAGLYKNGTLSINKNEAKIIYSPVEYKDFKSGKKRKTGATIFMVKESGRWLFNKEKGFTSIKVN